MASGNTQRKKRTDDRRTSKVDRRDQIGQVGNPEEHAQLVDTCGRIGALLFGQKQAEMNVAFDVLRRQSRALVLKPHLETWVPKFQQTMAKLEGVFGPGLMVDEKNLIADLRAKAAKAGYQDLQALMIDVVVPALSYHSLLMEMNNVAAVTLDVSVRERVASLAPRIHRVVCGLSTALFLKSAMG